MPAAAVIPAPIAYIKVVAVKKLVVESVSRAVGSPLAVFNWHVLRDVLPVGVCSSAFRACDRVVRCERASPRCRASPKPGPRRACARASSCVRARARCVRGGRPNRNPVAVLFAECRGGPVRLL